MKRAALLFGLLTACGPLTPPQLDGGAGGGIGVLGGGTGTTGGGTSGGGVGTTGGGGGSPAGGGSSTGGGAGVTGGGGASWSFGAVALTTLNTNSGTMVGLAENSAGVWALSSNSRLFLATDAGFEEKVQLTQLSSPFYPVSFRSDSSGRLFFVSSVWIGWCDSGCSNNNNWNYEQLQSGSTTLSDACPAPGGKIVAVGRQGSGNTGVAYLLSGGTFSTSATPLGVDSPNRCWVSGSGDVRIAASGAIGRYDGTQFFADTTDSVSWQAGASVPGHEWAFASGPRVAESPSWAVTEVGTNIHQIYSAISVSPTLIWGFGGSGLSSPTKLWRFDGSTWAPANPDLNGFKMVNAALKVSDGSVYFAGTGPDDKPAIGRGVPP